MSSADARIVEIFREEASERLDRMVDYLLAIEAQQDPGDALAGLFRDAHSLKGSAGMLGFEEVGVVAHAVEDVLEDVRRAGAALPVHFAEALLRAVDAMRRGAAGETGFADETVTELRALSAPGPTPESSPASEAAAPVAEPAAPTAPEPSPPAAAGAASAPTPPPTPPPTSPPRASVRVAAAKVDRLLDAVGETVLNHRTLGHLLGRRSDEDIDTALGDGDLLLDELQDAVIELRTQPLSSVTAQLPRFVRDLAVAGGKEVTLTMSGVDTQLDNLILDGLSDPLVHILRNSIAHGIEAPAARLAAGKPARGSITLRAEQRGGRVTIDIFDDGRGVSETLLEAAAERGGLAEVLAEQGFSTAEAVTDIAGRGVGMDAVKRHVESLGGTLTAQSETGTGMGVTLTLPVTLAIQHVLLVERGGQPFGVPLASIAEVVTIGDVATLGGQRALEVRGESVPLRDLAAALGAPEGALPEHPPALVLQHSGTRIALACDRLLGEEEVIVKRLGSILEELPGYLGAAILGDGRIALIVDPAGAAVRATARRAVPRAPAPQARRTRVLVVDDQFTVRELQRSILEAAGYDVTTATDGRDAVAKLAADGDIALMVTDLDMPEMDGLSLLRHVRQDGGRSSLPVVIITSKGSDEDRKLGLDAGADAYIAKDQFDQQALLDTIERLIGP